MRRFKATVLIPHEREFDAIDMQDAHNQVAKMLANQEGIVPTQVHSILEVEPAEPIGLPPE